MHRSQAIMLAMRFHNRHRHLYIHGLFREGGKKRKERFLWVHDTGREARAIALTLACKQARRTGKNIKILVTCSRLPWSLPWCNGAEFSVLSVWPPVARRESRAKGPRVYIVPVTTKLSFLCRNSCGFFLGTLRYHENVQPRGHVSPVPLVSEAHLVPCVGTTYL